jgi:hypothetical protein
MHAHSRRIINWPIAKTIIVHPKTIDNVLKNHRTVFSEENIFTSVPFCKLTQTNGQCLNIARVLLFFIKVSDDSSLRPLHNPLHHKIQIRHSYLHLLH